MLKVYEYSGCGTCRKALKYLDSLGIDYDRIPIREQVPDVAEISAVLDTYQGNVRRLFNTSGQTYREMGIKEKLDSLSTDEVIALLRSNGNLIKRPFIVGDGVALVGFKQPDWDSIFSD